MRWDVRRLGTIALIALPIVIAAVILRLRDTGSRPPGAGSTASDKVILDHLQAAEARRDWVETLLWAERLGARRPNDPVVLRARGTAWNNYAIASRPMRARERPALRTSLERMECLRHALGLLDSSATAATSSAVWLAAMSRIGDLDETLGLSGDALFTYELVKQRLPEEDAPALRAYWLRANFYDPVHPDTSEWDRRMRSLGLR
jgi:hypothetical protein